MIGLDDLDPVGLATTIAMFVVLLTLLVLVILSESHGE